jgi:hypothetical protein
VNVLGKQGADISLRALEQEQRPGTTLARVASGSTIEFDVEAWRADGRRRRWT